MFPRGFTIAALIVEISALLYPKGGLFSLLACGRRHQLIMQYEALAGTPHTSP